MAPKINIKQPFLKISITEVAATVGFVLPQDVNQNDTLTEIQTFFIWTNVNLNSQVNPQQDLIPLFLTPPHTTLRE